MPGRSRKPIRRITQYVVIGTHPTIDTSVTVGPFNSSEAAYEASRAMDALGYVTEFCPLEKLADLEPLTGWEDETVYLTSEPGRTPEEERRVQAILEAREAAHKAAD